MAPRPKTQAQKTPNSSETTEPTAPEPLANTLVRRCVARVTFMTDLVDHAAGPSQHPGFGHFAGKLEQHTWGVRFSLHGHTHTVYASNVRQMVEADEDV